PLLMIPSYSLAQVFGISISEQRKIYFNHRNTLISLLSNTLSINLKTRKNQDVHILSGYPCIKDIYKIFLQVSSKRVA
ncbi:hypothetical protein CBG25_11730, partial [Arsenophonus sp. ENCA]|uniref:hypothetical protein n=1 Tax=Arsenophonus sp. ENCA TaxID=1987579 RepID=UPI000BC69AEA